MRLEHLQVSISVRYRCGARVQRLKEDLQRLQSKHNPSLWRLSSRVFGFLSCPPLQYPTPLGLAYIMHTTVGAGHLA